MNSGTFVKLAAPAMLALGAGLASSAFACGEKAECGGAEVAARSANPAQARLLAVRGEDKNAQHVWSDGKTELRIVREGGKLKAYINGKEVINEVDEGPASGAHHADMRMLHERMRALGAQGMLGVQPPMPPNAPFPPAAALMMKQPRVMIGVTMETSDESGHEAPDGYEAENITVIQRVVEGLPAEKAGLEEGDIVVAIDGDSSASPAEIRAALKDKEPGDNLKLRVLRGGDKKDIVIQLAEYDGQQLGAPTAWGFSSGDAPPAPGAEDMRGEELRAKMAALSDKLEELANKMGAARSDDERRKIGDEMGRIGGELGEVGGELARNAAQGQAWSWNLGDGQNMRMRRIPRMRIDPGDGHAPKAYLLEEHGHAPAHGAESDHDDAMDKRLDRLEKMIEKLVEKESKDKSQR